MTNENGWEIHSKLVLKELETLAKSIQQIQEQIGDLKSEIAEIKAREDRVQVLSNWKDRVDDVVSPSQMKALVDDVEALKLFKIKAITIFAVVQSLIVIGMGLIKYL
tara:strand:+ start:195 stop:515 length:321 start_codon:yes stop_codon:yes gene_type:complete